MCCESLKIGTDHLILSPLSRQDQLGWKRFHLFPQEGNFGATDSELYLQFQGFTEQLPSVLPERLGPGVTPDLDGGPVGVLPDEALPLPEDVLGQAGHLWVGVFAHLVHRVTWEREQQLLWDWQLGKTAGTS